MYQRDSVGVIMTALPLPIYLRNLYFRYSHSIQHPETVRRQCATRVSDAEIADVDDRAGENHLPR